MVVASTVLLVLFFCIPSPIAVLCFWPCATQTHDTAAWLMHISLVIYYCLKLIAGVDRGHRDISDFCFGNLQSFENPASSPAGLSFFFFFFFFYGWRNSMLPFSQREFWVWPEIFLPCFSQEALLFKTSRLTLFPDVKQSIQRNQAPWIADGLLPVCWSIHLFILWTLSFLLL